MNLFRNALLLDPQNISTFTLLITGILWLAILGVIFSDLYFVDARSKLNKVVWIALLMMLPILGGATYALSSLIKGLRAKRNA